MIAKLTFPLSAIAVLAALASLGFAVWVNGYQQGIDDALSAQEVDPDAQEIHTHSFPSPAVQGAWCTYVESESGSLVVCDPPEFESSITFGGVLLDYDPRGRWCIYEETELGTLISCE